MRSFRPTKSSLAINLLTIKFYEIIQTNQVLFGYQFINNTLPKDILDLFYKTLIYMIITQEQILIMHCTFLW